MSGTDKKILALLAVMMFIASAVCIVVDTKCTSADEDVTVELGTKSISAEDFGKQFGGNGRSHYDYSGEKDVGILYLDDFEFTTTKSVAVECAEKTIIEATGNNRICSGANIGEESTCILGKKSVTITGDPGSELKLTSRESKGDGNLDSCCIRCEGNRLAIVGGLSISLTLGKAPNNSYGIWAGEVIVLDSELYVHTHIDTSTVAINCPEGDVTFIDSVVEVTGGSKTAITSTGINCGGAVLISGKKTRVVIDCDDLTTDSENGAATTAIQGPYLTIDDGAVVEANGGNVSSSRYSVFSVGISCATVRITDAVVTATGGNAIGNIMASCGLSAQTVSISNSTLNIAGGEISTGAMSFSFGITTTNPSVISGSNVIKSIRGHTSAMDGVTIPTWALKELEGCVSLGTGEYVPIRGLLSEYREIRTVGNIITFDFNDGKTPGTKEWHPNGEIVTIPDCTIVRDGYEFKGWTDGVDFYEPGSTYKMTKEPLKLTAVWENHGYSPTTLLVSLLLITVIAIAVMCTRRCR